MNYEKKYKEALERAKGLLEDMDEGDYFASSGDIENIFPELKEKESEDKDEMIRQCLIEHIKCNKDLNWSLFQWFKPDTIIAWLEKQKVTDEEMIFRPIAGTDIRIAAKQALEKIDIGKKVVLAFNGAYIPVNGKTVGEIDSEYDAWIEKQGENKKLDADKVIAWMKNTIKQRAENYGVYKETHLILPYNSIEDLINDFKEDFGL